MLKACAGEVLKFDLNAPAEEGRANWPDGMSCRREAVRSARLIHGRTISNDVEAYAREMGPPIQRYRIGAGLAQEDLAHHAGLTRTHD